MATVLLSAQYRKGSALWRSCDDEDAEDEGKKEECMSNHSQRTSINRIDHHSVIHNQITPAMPDGNRVFLQAR
jgi:hypothetical protein